MSTYQPPLKDMQFVIDELVGFENLIALEPFRELDADLVTSILDEAGRINKEIMEPCNLAGDRDGARIEGDDVHAATGFNEAYQAFVEGGWPGISFNPDFGGQGMPSLLSFAFDEMLNSANMSFALCPMLTQAAVEALERHGSDELKQTYLHKMVSGEWTGTMNLTESQAGSNLGALRCQAIPEDDHYLIKGTKIFITWGDHAMTENIVHMVLARLPDAPAGVNGISLFLIPKYMVNDDGSLGSRNDVYPASIEHKLGIHGSPTCVMEFGRDKGAIGYLIGEPNRGLKYMFTMMNNARLKVGLEGLGLSERAYQHSRQWAFDRVQGRPPGGDDKSPICGHPDVRRMMMLQKSLAEAMRVMAYTTATHTDFAEHETDADKRQYHQSRVDLMVPVVKAWCTEHCQEVSYLGIQIFGGMGFVEESGAAQYYRDARITTIYEGTTGIQSQDFAGRKIIRDSGKAITQLGSEIQATIVDLNKAGMSQMAHQLTDGLDSMHQAVEWLLANYADDQSAPNAVCYNLLMTCGTVIAAWGMARSALAAHDRLTDKSGEKDFLDAKIKTATFFADHILPRATASKQAVIAGSESIMSLSDHQL